MTVPFWKVQSVGNDFVLLLEQDLAGRDMPSVARRVCERRFSIGADGLLVLDPTASPIGLKFYNPDGSVDFCGNGLRCAALLAVQQGWAASPLTIRFWDQEVRAEVEGNVVTATLPPASFEPEDVPVMSDTPWIDRPVQGVKGAAVSTGSTHFVVVEDTLPQESRFKALSPLIECDPVFPERTTVMWTAPAGERAVEVRIWERGAGETLGCGTGAVASAVVQAINTGRFGTWEVRSKGGLTLVTLTAPDSPILSSTSPETVYKGLVSL